MGCARHARRQAVGWSFSAYTPRFEEVFNGLPTRVAQWKCRGLAHLCKTQSLAGEQASLDVATKKGAADEFAALASFPPRFRDIPCKPLLFDLAFPLIVQPDLEELIAKKQQEEKKGLLSGLGSRLSGFWGRGQK